MPIYDYECPKCGHVNTDIITGVEDEYRMEGCGHLGVRLITMSGTNVNTISEDAGWIRHPESGPLAVMDRNSDKPDVQAYIKDPTRSNLNKAMAAEEIRHVEAGEMNPSKDRQRRNEQARQEERQLDKAVHEKQQQRRSINLRGS